MSLFTAALGGAGRAAGEMADTWIEAAEQVRGMIRDAVAGEPVMTLADMEEAARLDFEAQLAADGDLTAEQVGDVLSALPGAATTDEVVAMFDADAFLRRTGFDEATIEDILERAAMRAGADGDYQQAIEAEARARATRHRSDPEGARPGQAEEAGTAEDAALNAPRAAKRATTRSLDTPGARGDAARPAPDAAEATRRAGAADGAPQSDGGRARSTIRLKVPFVREPVPIDSDRAWKGLSLPTRERVRERLRDIRIDGAGHIVYERGGGTIVADWTAAVERAGDPLRAAVDVWLRDGPLAGDARRFLEVLRLAGVPMNAIRLDPVAPTTEQPRAPIMQNLGEPARRPDDEPARVDLPDRDRGGRALDGAELQALRRAAARLERPADGVFFRITDDGRAVATGPKGVRIPEAFRRFAEDHGLTFVAQREGLREDEIPRAPFASGANFAGMAAQSAPMPTFFRESGALYAAEMGGGKPDRTDRTYFDLTRGEGVVEPIDAILPPAIQPAYVSTPVHLAAALRKYDAGEISEEQFALAVRAEIRRRQDRKLFRGARVRGADWLRERLIRARRTGELSAEQTDLALWLLDQAPQLATDLGISIREGNEAEANGTYNVLARVVTIFASRANENTATHEILHHTERMMPADVQAGIRAEWLRQLREQAAAARERADAGQQAMLDWMLEAAEQGDDRLALVIWKGIGGNSLRDLIGYQYAAASEFWAVNAARLLRERHEATSWIERARQWLRELIAKAKDLLGLSSDAAVIRGLEAVLEGDGSFVTPTMISRLDGVVNELGAEFARAVHESLGRQEPQRGLFHSLGQTPAVLRAVGLRDLPLRIGDGVVQKMHFEHGLPERVIAELPRAIGEPIMVFGSETMPGSFVVVTDLEHNGAPVIVSVKPDAAAGRAIVNLVTSGYAKDRPGVMQRWVDDGLLRYVDQSKRRGSRTTSRLRLPAVGPGARGAGRNVVTERDLVKGGGGDEFADESEGGFAANPLNRFDLPDESNFRAVQRRMQDYLIRLKLVQEAVAGQGGTVGVAQDAYRAEERMHGRIQAQLDDFKNEHMRPLMKKLADAGLTPDDLALFAYAMHAPERNAHIADLNPALAGNGSGMTDAQAGAVLDRFRERGVSEALEDAHRDLLAITRKTRRILVDAGLIPREQFERWESMYRSYVPLRGFEAVEFDADGNARFRKAGGIDVRGEESKPAHGRTTQAGRIIENIILDHERAIVRAERNAVGKVFLDLVTSNPDPALWEVDASRATALPAADDRQLALFDVEQAARVPEPIDRGEQTIGVKVGGRNVYVKIHDPLLARALRRAYLDETGDLQRVIAENVGWYSNWIRNTVTRYNPLFVVVNTVRDAQTGALSTLDELGWEGVRRYARHYAGALDAAWRHERHLLDAEAREWDRWFREYKAAGAITGGFFMRDASDVFDELRAELIDAGGSVAPRGAGLGRLADRAYLAVRGAPAAKLVAATLRAVEMLGSASENAARVAAYRTARELGRSAAEAASIAKNLTTNFNRKGEWGTAMNALYLFYNASVQGSARTFKALRSRNVQAVVAGMTAFAFALALGNAQWGGDDDDGEANWDKVPDHEKERNLIVMLPPAWDLPWINDRAGRAKYLKIPLPYGFNVFPVLGYGLADALRYAGDPRRGKSPARIGISIASALADAFNPVGGGFDPTEPVQSALAVAPTMLDLPIQLATESNAFGRPVAPPRSAWDPRPDSERLFLSDADTVQGRLARWLNAATGGDRARSGLVDVTPGTLETLARGTTGGIGTFIADTLSTLGQFSDSAAAVNPRNVPFLRQFYGQADNRWDQAQFYERRREIERRYRQNLLAAKMGIAVDFADPENAAVQRMGEHMLMVNRFLSQLRRQELLVIEDPKLSERERRLKREVIDLERTALMRGFNRAFNDVFKPAQAGRGAQRPALPAAAGE